MVCTTSKDSGGTTVYKKRFGNGVPFGSFLPQNPPEEQKNHSFVREVKLALKEGRAQLQFF
jgi:hypothetical protein